MQISKDRLELAHDLAFKSDVHAKHPMRRWVLWPHRDFEQFAVESRTHCRGRSLDWFQRLDARGHANGKVKKVTRVTWLQAGLLRLRCNFCNIVTLLPDSLRSSDVLRAVQLRSRRIMLFCALEHIVVRRRLVFVVVRLAIIFAHWMINKFIPHQNAPQIGMVVEAHAIKIKNLALLKFRAPPNGRE